MSCSLSIWFEWHLECCLLAYLLLTKLHIGHLFCSSWLHVSASWQPCMFFNTLQIKRKRNRNARLLRAMEPRRAQSVSCLLLCGLQVAATSAACYSSLETDLQALTVWQILHGLSKEKNECLEWGCWRLISSFFCVLLWPTTLSVLCSLHACIQW